MASSYNPGSGSGGYSRNRQSRRRGWATRGSAGVGGGQGYQAGRDIRTSSLAFKNSQEVKGGVKQRALKRFESLDGVKGVKVKDGVTGVEARKIKRLWLDKRGENPGKDKGKGKNKGKGGPRAVPYNPLTPLTGDAFNKELAANVKYEFGGARRELEAERRTADQQIANTAGYYDDYRKAVQDANAQINANNTALQQGTQARTDQAYQQDMQAQQGRDAAAAAEAQKFGRPAPQTTEGYQAVQGARAIGNATASTIAGQSALDANYNARRAATSVQAKAEAIGRDVTNRRGIDEDARALEEKIGAYKTKFRTDTRGAERQWSAVRKEFELDAAGDKTQENVAKLYSKAKVKSAYLQALAYGRIADAKKLGAKLGLKQAKIYSDAKRYSADRNAENSGGGGGSGGSSSSGPSNRFSDGDRRDAKQRFRSLVRYAEQGTTPPGAVDPLMKGAVEEHVRNGRRGVSSKTARKIKSSFGISLPVYTPTVNRPGNAPSGNRSRGGDSSRPT